MNDEFRCGLLYISGLASKGLVLGLPKSGRPIAPATVWLWQPAAGCYEHVPLDGKTLVSKQFKLKKLDIFGTWDSGGSGSSSKKC